MGIEKRNEMVAEAVRQGAVDRVIGSGEKRVRFLAQGEYNINYRVDTDDRSYVLRLNTGSQIPVENQIEYEFLSLKALEPSGVTPKAFGYDRNAGALLHPWLVMEFLEGRPVRYEKDGPTVMRLLASVHGTEITPNSHFLIEEDIVTARFQEGERLLKDVWDSPHVKEEAKEVFRRVRDILQRDLPQGEIFRDGLHRTVNNTELNSHNFLIGTPKSFVIDWEKPVLSDPVQDLVHFWAPTSTLWKTQSVFGEKEKEELLAVYEKTAPKDPQRREKIRVYTPYLYWRAFTWCAFALHQYNQPDCLIRNEDTYRTLHRYLDPEFMRLLWQLSV